MQELASPLPEFPGADTRFAKSLVELRALRSQLHLAADHCEAAFLKTPRRKILVENTKGYVCEAVVTVVDHLGTVAAELERAMRGAAEVARTEQRLDCLSQRILTCRQYAVIVELSAVRLNPRIPRHLPRYMSPFAVVPALGKSSEDQRGYTEGANLSNAFDSWHNKEETGAVGRSYTQPNSGNGLSMMWPVLKVSSSHSNPSQQSFGSQVKVSHFFGKENKKKKKQVHNSYLFSLLRRRK